MIPIPLCSRSRSWFALALAASALAQAPVDDPAVTARRAAFRAAGVVAPLRLYPVQVLGRADRNVAEALGLVLERRGLSSMQIADDAFDAGDTAWADLPAKFRAHVQQQKERPARQWCLYAQFLGDPRRGPQEVRFFVADPDGELVFADRQVPTDPAFQRTAGRDPDPLGCSTLVAERLLELAAWEAVPGGVVDGPFAQLWQQKSGTPSKQELRAIAGRQRQLRKQLATATLRVLPTVGTGAGDPARLAKVLQAELGVAAAVPADGKPLVVPASQNQQRRLWDLAAALRTSLQQQPIDSDYAVVADVGLDPEGGHGYVNVVVLTKAGEVVVADFQNDQHPLFQQRAPKVLQDGEDLAVARLRALLR